MRPLPTPGPLLRLFPAWKPLSFPLHSCIFSPGSLPCPPSLADTLNYGSLEHHVPLFCVICHFCDFAFVCVII